MSVIFIHDLDLLGDPMHLMVETLKIWSLVIVYHLMSSVIHRVVGAWSR